MQAVAERLSAMAPVTGRAQAGVRDRGDDRGREDQPEVSGRGIGVPEAGLCPEIEKRREQLGDRHGYSVPSLSRESQGSPSFRFGSQFRPVLES